MQGSLNYLQRITITDAITGNRCDLKSGTFARNGRQFCTVSVGSHFYWDTASTQLVVARINDLHPTKLELTVYMFDYYWEHKIFSGWSSVLWWTLSRGLTIHLRPPADFYFYIVGQLPTGTQEKSDIGGSYLWICSYKLSILLSQTSWLSKTRHQ